MYQPSNSQWAQVGPAGWPAQEQRQSQSFDWPGSAHYVFSTPGAAVTWGGQLLQPIPPPPLLSAPALPSATAPVPPGVLACSSLHNSPDRRHLAAQKPRPAAAAGAKAAALNACCQLNSQLRRAVNAEVKASAFRGVV